MAAAGWFVGDEHLRRDLWGALLQVANWVDLAAARATPTLVGRRRTRRCSPLDHYWSLAIEEQFYWVWPLALARHRCGWRSRRPHARSSRR